MKEKRKQHLMKTQTAMAMPEPRAEESQAPIAEVVEEQQPETRTTQEEVNRYGYQSINSAPRNGTLIFVSETGADRGEIVFWKRTRAFANATHKWEETGFFVNSLTNLPLAYRPQFWRTRGMYEI